MTTLTNDFSSSNIRRSSHHQSITEQLKEVLAENETCLATELQKKLTDIEEAKSFSILPKDLYLQDHNPQENLSTGEEKNPHIPCHLHVLSHVFLERELNSSALEGMSVRTLLQVIKGQFPSLKIDEQIKGQLVEALDQMHEMTTLIVDDISIPKDEIIDEIKKFIFEDSLLRNACTANQYTALQEIVKSPQFYSKMAKFLENEFISSKFIQENRSLLMDQLPIIITDILCEVNNGIKFNGEISQKEISGIPRNMKRMSLLRLYGCSERYYEICKQKNRPLIDYIKTSLINLKPHQRLSIPSGYINIYGGHAMIIIMKKNEDNTVNISIINTGEGTQYHANTENTIVSSQGKKICTIEKRRVISALCNFYHVPLEEILAERNGNYPFLQYIVDYKTLPFHLYFQNSIRSQADLFYKMINIYLMPYQNPTNKEDETSLLIYDQESGTCAWSSLKALIRLYMPDKQIYYEFSHQLKTNLFIASFKELTENRLLSTQTRMSYAKIIYRCAKYYICSLEEKIAIKMQITAAEKIAIATCVDILERISTYLESGHKTNSKQPFLHQGISYTHEKLTDYDMTLLNSLVGTSVFETEEDHECLTNSKTTLQYQILTPSPFKHFTSMQNIDEDFLALNNIENCRLDLHHLYFEEYIDSITFDDAEQIEVKKPELVLKQLRYMMSVINADRFPENIPQKIDNSELKFLRNWKAYLLATLLVQQIDPHLLTRYPQDSFGFLANKAPLHFLIASNKARKNFQICLQHLEKHNEKAEEDYHNPLFHNMMNVCLHLTNCCTATIKKDATTQLYLHLINKNPPLFFSLMEMYKETHKKQQHLENPSHLELSLPLYEDFDSETGILSTHGLGYITDLKMLFLYAIHSLENPDIPRVDILKVQINKSTKLLSCRLDNKAHENHYSIFKGHFPYDMSMFNGVYSIHRNQINFNESSLSWSNIPLEDKESFLIKNKQSISAALPGLLHNETYLSFYKDILLLGHDDPLRFDRLFTILSRPENEECLNNKLLFTLFQTHLLSISIQNPKGNALIELLRESESLRQSTAEFIHLELGIFSRSEKKNNYRISWFLQLAMELKLQLYPIPFLPDLKEDLIQSNTNNCALISQAILDYFILFEEELSTEECLIDLLLARLQVDVLTKEQILFFSRYLPLISNILVCHGINQKIKEACIVHCHLTKIANEIQDIWYDKDLATIWIVLNKNKIGIDLQYCRTIIKGDKGNCLLNAKEFNSFITQHPFFQDLKRNFDEVLGVIDNEEMMIETVLGSFEFLIPINTEDEEADASDYDFLDYTIIYIPSDKISCELPERYKKSQWEFISNTICTLAEDDYYFNSILALRHMTLENVKSKYQGIFKSLPFFSRDILYSFISQTQDHYAILFMNSSQKISYIFEVEIHSKEVLIYDVSNKKVLRPLHRDSTINTLMPDMHCFKEYTPNEQHLCIIDETNRSIRLNCEGHQLKLLDKQSYTFIATEHDVFPYAKQIMLFQSDTNPTEYYVLTSKIPAVISSGIKSESEEFFIKPHLFVYKIQNEKIIPLTLCDELYLCILKIQNETPDRYDYIDKIKKYIYQRPSQQSLDFASDILNHILSGFNITGFAKDEFCLLALHLSAFFIQRESAKFNKQMLFMIYKYYKTYSRIPDQHLIPRDLERIILICFSQSEERSWAAEWMKFLDYLKEDSHNIKFLPILRLRHNFTLPQLTSSANVLSNKPSSEQKLKLFTPVSFAEIAACEQNGYKTHINGCFFEILFELNHLEYEDKIIALLKICRYVNKDLFTQLQIDPLQDERSLIDALCEKKNRIYLNKILDSRKIQKPENPPILGKEISYLHMNEVEPIVIDKIEKSIAFLHYTRSEAICVWHVFKKSLSLSKIHILSKKIEEITKNVFILAQQIRLKGGVSQHIITLSEAPGHDIKTTALALSILKSREDEIPQLEHNIENMDTREIFHHLDVFFTSLNIIIEDREKTVLQIIKHLHQTSAEQINPFLLLTAKHARGSNYNTLETLLSCFSDAFVHSYTKQIQPLKFTTLKRLQSPRKLIMAIHEEVANLLLLKIWQRKLAHLQQGIRSGMIPPSIDISIDFSEQNIHWLLFEYTTGFDLREKQREVLAKLEDTSTGHVQNHVAQMMMGQGKTSVIIPLLSYSSSCNEKTSLIICLKAQLSSIVTTLTLFQNDVFSQKVIALDMQRRDINEQSLKALWENVSSARIKKYVFIAASESLQTLELEFINMIINKSTDTKSFDYLQKILRTLVEECNCIVDEFAHIADVSRVTNFPLLQEESNIKKVPIEHINMMRDLFIFILSKQDPAFQKILHNEQIHLTQQELSLIDTDVKSFIKKYFIEKHPSLFEEEFIDQLLCQYNIDNTFAQALSNHPLKEACSQLALAHLCLKAIIPKALKQCGGRNYGRSIDPKTVGKIIPYQGVGSPATTEFGFAYEAISYHFMYAAQFGLDATHIATIAKKLRSEGMIKARALMTKLDQTEESLFFYSMTGVTLSQTEKTEGIDAAVRKLENDKENGQISAILHLEALNAFEHVLCFERYLSSTPHNLFSQFKTVRGLTGTPWNHPTYGVNFSGNIHLDTSTEEQIIQAYCSKPYVRGIDSFAYITKEKQASSLLASILDVVHVEDRENITAIVDTGGLFKENNNSFIANQILTTLIEVRAGKSAKISVLFFSCNDKNPLPDNPYIMQWDSQSQKTEIFPVNDFSPHTLNSHNVLTNPYFVYFDERHSIGTDIPLAEKAVILITIDSNTASFQFTQGIMRARRFLLEQNAITIIPQSMLEAHPQISRSAGDLLRLMKHNEELKLSSNLYRSYKMQLEDTCRSFLLNILLSTSATKAEIPRNYQTILEAFPDFFIRNEQLCPLQLIANKLHVKNVIDELSEIASDIVQRLKQFNISDSNLNRITIQLEKILNKAKIDPLLHHSSDYNSLFNEVVVENHLDQQMQQQTEQLVEEELYQEITCLQSGSTDAVGNDTRLPWERMIAHFTYNDTPIVDPIQNISIIQIANYGASPFQIAYQKAFTKIYLTNNAIGNTTNDLKRLFFKDKKQLFSLLIVKKNDFAQTQNHAIVALTYSETKHVYDLIQSRKIKSIFLLNIHGQPICDSFESLDLHIIKQSVEHALIEANVFNMHISELTKLSSATYQWLNPADDTENLRAIRERLLRLICVISEQKELLAIIKTIQNGELLGTQERKKTLASQIICRAQEALFHGDEKLARQNLFHLPKEFLSIVPPHLFHILSKDHLSKLLDKEQITTLSQRDCIYLQKGQIKYLNIENIQKMIQSGRMDIAMDPNFPFHMDVTNKGASSEKMGYKNRADQQEMSTTAKRFKRQ